MSKEVCYYKLCHTRRSGLLEMNSVELVEEVSGSCLSLDRVDKCGHSILKHSLWVSTVSETHGTKKYEAFQNISKSSQGKY